ncbi:actin-binding protein [Bdellovibrio bacteriovorus]|uniref:Actin-binding protein n=1 Tax=Bdellovibrio bacteriovorus TaxID=959 RepID=A0A150WSV4_BDEBC|nr:hypothetical protein [Bdellovibrio bacteriovorus]KYG67285.1 actin-binding protein [Bdellovibrio bacteriovorus]
MATPTFQKMIQDLTASKGVQNLLEGFQKLNDEIKKKETELKTAFDQQRDEKIEMAWKKYQEIIKALSASEEKIEKEVNKTIKNVKASADSLEKNIAAYKKKAIAQKAKWEKSVFNKTMSAKTSKKKATVKKAAKKTVRKATKKAK